MVSKGRARMSRKVLPKGPYWLSILAGRGIVGFESNQYFWIPCIILIQKQTSDVLKIFSVFSLLENSECVRTLNAQMRLCN